MLFTEREVLPDEGNVNAITCTESLPYLKIKVTKKAATEISHGLHLENEVAASPNTGEAVDMLKLKNEFIETVYRDHERAIFRFLLALLKNRQDAEEVKQEVFLKLLQGSTAENIRNPRAFVYRTAKNLALNRIRYRNVRSVEDKGAADDDPASTRAIQDKVLESRQELAQLVAIVEQMPPKCRKVFILYKFHEMNYAEISQKLNISKSMVKKHLRRAVSRCVEGLESRA